MTAIVDRPVAGRQAPATPPPGRRNSLRMLLGALLVLATVVVFWQADLRRHAGTSFLATTRAVPAGQVITDADLRVVRVADPSGLALLAADRRDDVVGRSAAVPLAAGSPLTAAQLGPPVWPPTGQAVIALPVKPGRAPTELAPGSRVVVLVVPTAGNGQDPQAPVNAADRTREHRAVATVVSATAGADQVGTRLVTLLMPAAAAETVASASGDAALVQLSPQE